ncbi:MAG: hypothetical protein COV10_01330 [Candidatus Vogelbacteria bacterium CG10_big_fil_rev_8_21_14_0_10_51_16]|uniref:Peptidase S74 domain-containing protein n=1 Tax=Candidatus Vogelbacteria bacterium CG10_big_fil_rev_8_21_14_0_10_51_16 TaxID=1975045 RepID=A0A2H0RF64_9BACT|nr:MAG: hypothetical protein COV10_01330 [Candidatus Vogelbacteria bacterium CG10_big_fil_rev_8_21_14_0_10_51_16]
MKGFSGLLVLAGSTLLAVSSVGFLVVPRSGLVARLPQRAAVATSNEARPPGTSQAAQANANWTPEQSLAVDASLASAPAVVVHRKSRLREDYDAVLSQLADLTRRTEQGADTAALDALRSEQAELEAKLFAVEGKVAALPTIQPGVSQEQLAAVQTSVTQQLSAQQTSMSQLALVSSGSTNVVQPATSIPDVYLKLDGSKIMTGALTGMGASFSTGSFSGAVSLGSTLTVSGASGFAAASSTALSALDYISVGTTATSTIRGSSTYTLTSELASALLVYGSTTLQNFTFTNATGTNATTTNFYASNSLTVNGTASTSALIVSGSAAVSGNLGVGTTTPQDLFTIAATSDEGFVVRNVQYEELFSLKPFSGDDGEVIMLLNYDSDVNNPRVRLASNSSSYFNNGNVGVGSTTPWGLLSVNPDDIAGPSFVVGSSTKTDFIVTNGGNVGIGESLPGSKLAVSGNMTVGAGYDTAVAGTNSLLVQGTLGLGTTTSSAKLTLKQPGDGYGGGFHMIESITTDAWGMVIKTDESLYFGSASDPASPGNFTDRVVFTNTGNVGIGTTTPFSPLQVAGTGGLFQGITITDTNGAVDEKHWIVGPGSVSGSLSFTTLNDALDGPGERVTILQGLSGQIGIGTTTTDAHLSIHQPSGNAIMEFGYGNDNDDHWIIGAGTDAGHLEGGFVIGNTSGSDNGSNLFFKINKTTGNVGLATTTPWRTLSVTGTVGFDGLTAGAGAGALCLDANKQVTYSDGAACTGSSERFKHDIVGLESGLAAVLAMRPVAFTYNEDIGVKGRQIGFIAEEVELVDPRLVAFDTSGRPANVKYANFTAMLAKAIQELSAKVDAISARVGGGLATATNRLAEIFAGKVEADLVYARSALEVGTATTPVGVTLYDELTGEPTCLTIYDNAPKVTAGACKAGEARGTSHESREEGRSQEVEHASSPNSKLQTTNSDSDSDTEPPVITLSGNDPATIKQGDTFLDPGATVTDDKDDNLGIKVGGDTVDTKTPGTYTITHNATDAAGNKAKEVTRTVVVEENDTFTKTTEEETNESEPVNETNGTS